MKIFTTRLEELYTVKSAKEKLKAEKAHDESEACFDEFDIDDAILIY